MIKRRDFLTATAATSVAAAVLEAMPESASAAPAKGGRKLVAMLVYPKFTALDLVGPQHVFSMLPGYQVMLVGKTREPVVTDMGLTITPDCSFDGCPAEVSILFSPGGTKGTIAAMQDSAVLDFLRSRGEKAEYVTSVCTGSLVMGAAGLLRGYKATSHWVARDVLTALGAEPVDARVVRDRNRITAGGVTAGLDFGLDVAMQLASPEEAAAIQLSMEYDPHPPLNAGSPHTADAATTERMRKLFGPFVKSAQQAAEGARAGWTS